MPRIVPVCAASFGANTYLLISGNAAWVVDPSVSVDAILSAIRAEDAFPAGILFTHGHFDHVLSADRLRGALPSDEVYIHPKDAIMLTDGRKNAFYEFYRQERVFAPATRFFEDGQQLSLGADTVTVLHTPGHSPGSVCLLWEDGLITGDTLFADNVGRWDLWGGSRVELESSLARLRSLNPDLTIYPGHGNSARLGYALDEAAYYF